MLIEGIRICYPDMYELIKRNKEAFLIKENLGYTLASEKEKDRQRIIQLIDQATSQNTNDEKVALEKLLSILFPQLNHILKNNIFTSYEEKEIQKSKRIASDDYFPRYFLYSIPENDISDFALEEFLKSLDFQFSSVDEISKKLQSIIDPKKADGFIRKIILKVEKLSDNISKNLAKILAMNGQLFPKRDNFMLFSTYTLSARLIAELICNEHNQKSRVSFSKSIIEIAEPLPFSVEIMRSLRFAANSDTKQFTSEEIEKIRAVLIKKIAKLSKDCDFFFQYPEEVGMLLNIWKSGSKNNDVEVYFKEKTKNRPKHMNIFLSSLLGIYYSSSGVGKADFSRENFDVVKKIIEPAYIISKLEEMYGKNLYSDSFPNHRQDIDLDFRTAGQFAYFYKHPIEEEYQENPE